MYNNSSLTDPANKNEPYNEITKDFEVKLWSLINEIVKKLYTEIINNIQNEPYFSEQSDSQGLLQILLIAMIT